jgi:hypothetical protein
MITVGVDPGNNGCICVNIDGQLLMYDIPTYDITIAGKARKRIDFVKLNDTIQSLVWLGPYLVLVEEVGGLPKQSAPNAFHFGYGCGALYGMCVAHSLPVRLAKPQEWKSNLRVPGKGMHEGDIVKRADELFPAYTGEWRGPRGGLLLDRAEAALISHYATRLAK